MQPGEGAAASSKDAQKKAILQQKIKEIFETLVADGLDATTAAVRALQSCLQNQQRRKMDVAVPEVIVPAFSIRPLTMAFTLFFFILSSSAGLHMRLADT